FDETGQQRDGVIDGNDVRNGNRSAAAIVLLIQRRALVGEELDHGADLRLGGAGGSSRDGGVHGSGAGVCFGGHVLIELVGVFDRFQASAGGGREQQGRAILRFQLGIGAAGDEGAHGVHPVVAGGDKERRLLAGTQAERGGCAGGARNEPHCAGI